MRTCKILLVLLLVSGWGWKTHQDIVEASYYRMPWQLRHGLDLSLLKEGSIMPDKTFHDNRLHHYPESLNLTRYWLGKAMAFLDKGDAGNASLAIGIASHYITDSYSAPHYISKEPADLHSLYEHQIDFNGTSLDCESGMKLDELLKKGSEEEGTWFEWLAHKDSDIPSQSALRSADAFDMIIRDLFGYSCVEKDIKYRKIFISFSPKVLIILGICLIAIIAILIM